MKRRLHHRLLSLLFMAARELWLGVRTRVAAAVEVLRGETISREEAARLILQVPDDEWRGGRVIELSKYRRAARP